MAFVVCAVLAVLVKSNYQVAMIAMAAVLFVDCMKSKKGWNLLCIVLMFSLSFGAQAGLILHGVFPDKWARIIEEEIRYTDKMFNGFLVGKIIDSAIIGLLCFAGLSFMGFEAPAFIGVIIGITNIIPFFGPFIGAIPCGLLLLLENPMHCLYFIIFIFVLQQLDGNVIGPKILGNTTGVSSFWVIIFHSFIWRNVGSCRYGYRSTVICGYL